MRSTPPWKVSTWPLLVILPSGKMTTTSPLAAASVAASMAATSARRRSSAATGITPAARRNHPTKGYSV